MLIFNKVFKKSKRKLIMNIESIKFYSTVILITIVASFLSFSFIGIFLTEPDYSDYCNDSYYLYNPSKINANCSEISSPTEAEINACRENNGDINYKYVDGCPTEFVCETCQYYYNQAFSQFRLWNFIITSIIGVILIIISIKYKIKKNTKSWIYASITLSGIVILTFSIISYFDELNRYMKPLILLLELGLIILVARKNIKN